MAVSFLVGKKYVLGGQEEHGFDFGRNDLICLRVIQGQLVIICNVVEDMDFRFVRYA